MAFKAQKIKRFETIRKVMKIESKEAVAIRKVMQIE